MRKYFGAQSNQAPSQEESRRSIEEQTAAFLRRGGKIQSIPSGVTGIEKLVGSRQIVLSKKPA